MEFYILNQNEEVTATLSTDSTGEHTPVYSAVVDEKLGSYDTLELSIPSGVEHDLDIKEEYYIVFEDIKGFREYIINEVVDVDDGEISRTITAELSSIELLDEIIQTNLTGNNPTTILTNILKNTRWTIGNVDPSIYNSAFTEETEMVSVLEGIDLLSSSFNAEVSFSYAVAGNKITKRFVNLHKQMGANNGKRFEVDKDVTSIKRTIDTSSIKTAIIPFGAEPEEGKARLNIKDLVWSKAAGNPVDKPKGQEWIGDPTALAQWGKNNADGSRRHRFLAQEINVETAAELATMAWVHLGQYTKPKTTYEAVAMDLYTLTGDEDLKHEYVNLGDTVVITDYYFAQPLVVQTRVSELKRDLLEPLNNDLVFGDSLELFSTSRQADRLETIKKELSNRIELVRQSADGKSDTYLGSDEPISPNESDMWYRPHPTLPNETQFLIFNGLTWDIVLDTSNLDSVGKEVIAIIEQADRDREQAEADFESAKIAAKEYADTKAAEFDLKFNTETGAIREEITQGYTDALTDGKTYTDTKATEFNTKMEAVKTDLASTKTRADKAVSDAQTAITEAGFAKVDATTAKQNAVTAISTAQTAVTNSGTALTNAQDALNAYNNLEIGGRNLIIRYDEMKSTILGMTGLASTGSGSTPRNKIAVKPGEILAFTKTSSGDDYWRLSWFDSNGVFLSREPITSNEFTRVVPDNANFLWTSYPNDSEVKIERGNKATDWSPAPEDVQVQITDINGELSRKVAQTTFDTLNGTVTNQGTQISQSQTAIGLKADKTAVDTINQTVAKHTTDIKVTADGLALKAESSLVNSINGTVSTHTGQISANSTAIAARLTSAQVDSLVAGKKYVNETTLNATASGLSTSITQVSTDLSNLEVGGRNYFTKNTLITKNAVQALEIRNSDAPNGVYVVGDNTNLGSIRLNKVITSNGWWTISFKMRGNQSAFVGATVDICNLQATKVTTNNTNTFTEFSISANVTNYSEAVYNFIDFEKISWAYVLIDDIKVEKGNKASDWSPAPEDMATLEKFTTLEATVNGVQTTVGTKASQTQVTQLATQISSKVDSTAYATKMTQLDSSINLRVVQKDVTDAILSDKTIKDTRGTNELPSWYFANYPKQTVEEFKQRTTMGVTGSATYGQLTTKVLWNSTSGGSITQIFSSSDGVFQRIGNATASSWTAWDKVAEAGKLISQINVSTEGILLQGKRIQLDGDVTMTTAFVDRLDANTLSAVYADIATLKTKVLTADVITSTHLKVDYALVDKLTARTIDVDRFFSKTAVIAQVEAKSLTAVYADIATLRTKFLTADLITSTHLKSDTALITKLFATDANIGVLTSKTAFINSVKAVDIAADRITAGTLNAANVNIINLNASKIATGTITGANSAWNLNTGVMLLRNPSNGDDLYLTQGEISFKNGAQGRTLQYNSGGLLLRPDNNNTGTALNTGFILEGGVTFVQFNNRAGTVQHGRLQMTSDTAVLQIPNGADFLIKDMNGLQTNIGANIFKTVHGTGEVIYMQQNRIYTIRDGNRNIFLEPNGTGSVVAGNGGGTRWNMVASDFVKQSTRDSKTDIKPIETKGLDVINRLTPVSYKKKDKVAQGIIETELGFIAEDSLEVATVDGLGIYDSHITAYLVKAVQELNAVVRSQDEKIKQLESEK